MERLLERVLFATRWLLAPIYLGLSLVLIAVAIKFFQEAYHVLSHIWAMKETDVVLTALAMIDLALVASLVIMVMFSGYENFVSQIDVEGKETEIGWLGKLDAGTLKLKVAASIVAVCTASSISSWETKRVIASLIPKHSESTWLCGIRSASVGRVHKDCISTGPMPSLQTVASLSRSKRGWKRHGRRCNRRDQRPLRNVCYDAWKP